MNPYLEKRFLPCSFANRLGLGTLKAVHAFHKLSKTYKYVLRADIIKHFQSIDHQVLKNLLFRIFVNEDIQWLINQIIDSGNDAKEPTEPQWFKGDSLLDTLRPKGLPIGNLTSQCWSNVYLNPIDHFVTRTLRLPYVRYVDDFALFSNNKSELWQAKRCIIEQLSKLRLKLHDNETQVMPTYCGSPWLGFVIYPDKRMIKARKVGRVWQIDCHKWRWILTV